MKCPHCSVSASSRVVDTRLVRDARAIRRRRECKKCRERYTTYEYLARHRLQVRKRDGTLEAFQRAKLQAGLAKACGKRPASSAKIESLVSEIEDRLARSRRVKVRAEELGEMVMEALKRLDRVACIRYASVYGNFQDVTEFQEAVTELLRRERREARAREQTELPLPPDDSDDTGGDV